MANVNKDAANWHTLFMHPTGRTAGTRLHHCYWSYSVYAT